MAKKNISIKEAFEKEIELLRQNNKFSTADNYKRALSSISEFSNGAESALSSVDEDFIRRYNLYLYSRGIKRNSVSFYMRILRAVHNKAVRNRIIPRPRHEISLFENVYTGIDRGIKRSVDDKLINKVSQLDLKDNAPLEMARDFFIFCYCARGMAFVDMAFLKKSSNKQYEP